MVTLLFFGELRDLAIPASSIEFEGTVGELRAFIDEMYPSLKTKTFSIAVNKAMANDEAMIHGDSEVAVMPPFSGG